MTVELYVVLLYIFVVVVMTLSVTKRYLYFGYFVRQNPELAIAFDTQKACLCIRWVVLGDKNLNYQMSIR